MTLAVGMSLLALLNGARAQENEPPLRLDPVLSAAAEVKASEISRCGFEHDACGRPWDADLPRRPWFGENIASGYPTVRAVFNGWIDSPDHRANIMKPQFTRVGFARIGAFYVAEFSS